MLDGLLLGRAMGIEATTYRRPTINRQVLGESEPKSRVCLGDTTAAFLGASGTAHLVLCHGLQPAYFDSRRWPKR